MSDPQPHGPDPRFTPPANQPTGRSGPAYPTSRAFVVQLCDEQGDRTGQPLAGRIEHVVTGRAARFAGLIELASFVHETLSGVSHEGARPPGSGSTLPPTSLPSPSQNEASP